MQISLYRKNIQYGIAVPVKIYEIKVKTQGEVEDRLDVIGETILKLLEVGKRIDVYELSNLIGMGNKYIKIIEAEVDELVDNRNIILDKDEKVEKIEYEEKYEVKDFYILFDEANNRIIECLIDKKEYNQKYIMYENILNEEKMISLEKRKHSIDDYRLCYEIQELIEKSNNAIFDLLEFEEEKEFIKPNYKIKLEEIKNLANPIKAEFLYKVTINHKMELEFISPFNEERDSEYIKKYIKPEVDEREAFKMVWNGEKKFYDLEGKLEICKDRAKEYVEKYRMYDKEEGRIGKVLNIAIFKEMLEEGNGLEYGFSFNIQDVDSIVKSLLKEITIKLGEAKIEKKNVAIEDIIMFDNIEKVKLLEVIYRKRYRKILENSKVITSIGEKSIASYLSAIYLSFSFTNKEYDRKIFEAFKSNERINLFLNEVWMYRNSTVHNIENTGLNQSYDLDILTKGRLKEVIIYLMEELIYFVEFMKKYR